jgi:hypothetical protein
VPQAADAPDEETEEPAHRQHRRSGKHNRLASSGRQKALSTPSGGRPRTLQTSSKSAVGVGRGQPGAKLSTGLVALVGLLFAVLLVVGAVAVSSGPKSDSDGTTSQLPPPPPPPPPPSPNHPPPPPSDGQPSQRDVLAALANAEKLEGTEREADALLELDRVQDQARGPVLERIQEVHERLTGRVRGLLDDGAREIEQLLKDGQNAAADDKAQKLRPRLPATLVSELDARIEKARQSAKTTSESEDKQTKEEEAEWEEARKKARAAAAARKKDEKKEEEGELSAAAAGSPSSEFAGIVRSIVGRTQRDFFTFDYKDAHAAFKGLQPMDSASVDRLNAEIEMLHAFETFYEFVYQAFAKELGKEVKVDFKNGRRMHLRVTELDGETITFLGRDGEEKHPYRDLASWCLVNEGRKAAAGDPSFCLGAATFLAVRQKKHLALEQLARAPKDNQAVPVLKAILEDMEDDDAVLPNMCDPFTAERGNGTGQVFDSKFVTIHEDKPESDRRAALETLRRTRNFVSTHSTKHYDYCSNGPIDEVKDLAARMEQMFEAYKKVLPVANDPKRATPILLYRNAYDFQYATKMPEGVAGFYDGDKIAAMHGNYYTLTTDKVLYHEGAHQFEAFALGDALPRAGTWFLEGLAVVFESCQVDPKGGAIEVTPKERLRVVQRAMKAGTHIPLADLIATESKGFTGFHYSHAYTFVQFLRAEPDRLSRYVEGLKAGKQGAPLLEEVFKKPLPEIEKDWIAYVLGLRY